MSYLIYLNYNEINIDCKDCFKMQLEEITVLRSMFREPEELTFDNVENLNKLEAFVVNETALLEDTSLESVSFSMKLKIRIVLGAKKISVVMARSAGYLEINNKVYWGT
ncbi:hypothetical protein T02_14822, partial [Trichinella nativa]